MKARFSFPILRIVAIYSLISCLWIFFSDRLVANLVRDPFWNTQVQTYKGWFFVFASALLLYILIHKEYLGRKQAESDLESSQNAFIEMFSNNPNPMWVYDKETLRFLEVNQAAIAKYGYSREEFLDRRITDIRPVEDIPALEKYLRTNRPALRDAGQWRHLTRDQRMLTVQIVSHQMVFAGREAVLVTAEDLTYRKGIESAYQTAERKRVVAENQLNLDEARLEALLRLSQMADAPVQTITDYTLADAIRLTSSKSGFLAYRDLSTEKLTLYRKDETGNLTSSQVNISNSDPSRSNQALKRVVTTCQPVLINTRDEQLALTGDADEPNFRQMLIPVVSENQAMAVASVQGKNSAYDEADVRQLTLFMDGVWKFAELERMVERVRESELQLQAAIESLPYEFWIQDLDGRYLVQNSISRERWGNLVGITARHGNVPQEIRWLWNTHGYKAVKGEPIRTELSFPDQEDLGIFYTNILPFHREDQLRGIVGLHIDITSLKQRERELQAMVSTAAALRVANRPEEMIPIVLDKVVDLLDLDSALLVMMNSNTHEYQVEMARGSWQDLAGKQIPREDILTWRVLETGQTEVIPDLKHYDRPSLMVGAGNLNSAVGISLTMGGSPMGAIWIGSPREISDAQTGLLKAITDISASALYRARLNQQTELHLQRLTALRSIDLAITSSLDVRVTLNILLNQMSIHLGIDAADVLLYSTHTQMLTFAAGKGSSPPGAKTNRLRLGESLAGQVALERKIKIIQNLSQVAEPISGIPEMVAEGYISYIAVPLIAKAEIKGVLELFHRSELHPTPDWFDFLQAMSAQAAIAIDNAELFDQLQRTNSDLTIAYDATIEGWSRALELRDQEKEGHNKRVAGMTVRLAKILDVRDSELVHIRRGVLLHDIGKMAVPDQILLKAGPLSDEEWQVMRKHPLYAYEMLSNIPYLRPAIDIPYCHHERWDGMGYPRGLQDEQIPLSARIFSVVDIWDALRHERPYRSAWNDDKVMEYIRSQASRRLDPEVVACFLSSVDQFR